MKDAGKAIKPRILVVKHSLNRYTLPLPVEPGKAHIKYFVGYMEPLTEEALWKNGVDFERIGLLKMWKEIIQGKYDLVMTGIDYFPEFKGTFILCKLLGIPVAFLSDRWKWKERKRRLGLKSRLLTQCTNLFLDQADAYLVTGRKQAEYFASLGVRPEKIRVFYPRQCIQLHEAAGTRTASDVRKQLQVEEKTMFLYTGRVLAERKNLSMVIEAFSELRKDRSETCLVLVGYGRDRKKLMAHCLKRGLTEVHFVDFIEYTDSNLKAYYEAADVFVFVGKSEPNGFSLIEACAAGLPLITTEDVGAAYDYAVNGVNSFVIKPDDPRELLAAMQKLAASKELREGMGRASKEVMKSVQARLPSFEEALVELAGGLHA